MRRTARALRVGRVLKGGLPVALCWTGSLVLLGVSALRAGAASSIAAAAGELGIRLEPDPRGRPTLLYLFHEEDCAAYGGLVEGWNELHRAGDVRVIGVGLRVAEARRPGLASRMRPSPRFPLRFDAQAPAERLLLAAGFSRTPAALLLDAEGRLRLAVPSGKRAAGVDDLIDLVRAYARMLRNPPNGRTDGPT